MHFRTLTHINDSLIVMISLIFSSFNIFSIVLKPSADIFPNQLVWANGHFKLNDFNRCHFMYWNTTSNTESCPYLYQDYNAGEVSFFHA